jgi:hypothetical protein
MVLHGFGSYKSWVLRREEVLETREEAASTIWLPHIWIKYQIDGASYVTSGRFAAEFSVTLVVVKPDDQTYDAHDKGWKMAPVITWRQLPLVE